MTFRVSLCALLLGASLAAHADSRVHTVQAVQSTVLSDDFDVPGRVAIDGNFAIVISSYGGLVGLAYLYHRGADGEWTDARILLAVQTTTPPQRMTTSRWRMASRRCA